MRRVAGCAAAAFLAVASWSCRVPTERAALAGYPLEPVSPAPASAPAPEAVRAPIPDGPLAVTVEEAVLLALENNRAFSVQRYEPPISRTFVEEERAAFDPSVIGQLSYSRARAQGSADGRSSVSEDIQAVSGLDWFFPTGTGVALGAASGWTDAADDGDFSATRAGLTVTQALLRGYGLDANLAAVRQARLDVLDSEYELRGFAESLVAGVENSYWEYSLAARRIDIFSESLRLAEQQLSEIEERIKVGRLPETELAAAQAEVALRREALISARSKLATTRLELLRVVNPPIADMWTRDVALKSEPVAAHEPLEDVGAHVALAMRMRPDMNQARLEVAGGVLDVAKTRNGLLPVLDVFITLGKTGYAGSFVESVENLPGDGHDLTAGVTAAYPLGNRAPRARFARAVLERNQASEAVANLEQLVQVDVRSAYIVVQRTEEQIVATAATRKFQEETVRAETEKFRVGRSTSLLVGRAQRDLVLSQIAEVEAVVNYRQALVDLFRLEGSLLERRGIGAPGRKPYAERSPDDEPRSRAVNAGATP